MLLGEAEDGYQRVRDSWEDPTRVEQCVAQADGGSTEQQEDPTDGERRHSYVLNAERKLPMFLGDLRWSNCFEIRKVELGNNCID